MSCVLVRLGRGPCCLFSFSFMLRLDIDIEGYEIELDSVSNLSWY
jgi:hypothetical protein